MSTVTLRYAAADAAVARTLAAFSESWAEVPATTAARCWPPRGLTVVEDRLEFYGRKAHPEWRGQSVRAFSIDRIRRNGRHVFIDGGCRLILGDQPGQFVGTVELGSRGELLRVRTEVAATTPSGHAGDRSTRRELAAPMGGRMRPESLRGSSFEVDFVYPRDREFSRRWFARIVSRDGFAVEFRPPSTIMYRCGEIEFQIPADMSSREKVLHVRGIDVPRGFGGPGWPSRAAVIRDLQRAFAWRGTTVVVSQATDPET